MVVKNDRYDSGTVYQDELPLAKDGRYTQMHRWWPIILCNLPVCCSTRVTPWSGAPDMPVKV